MATTGDDLLHLPSSLPEQEPTSGPPARRALCLSGGGYRAAIFHLGALRRLNELGVLAQLDTISCVSGGSIIGAHLATRIAARGGLNGVIDANEWEQAIADPFRQLAGQNIRTEPLKRRLFRPWNWVRPWTAVQALAERYEADLTALKLDQLADHPRFVFCAADLTFGVNWVFEKARVGDYQAGYQRPASGIYLAKAVAASSCFPPVFDPMPIRLLGLGPGSLKGGDARRRDLHTEQRVARRDSLVRDLLLNDGGNYDNLALEPVWGKGTAGTPPVILVSDGGATFDVQSTRFLHQRLLRYPAVLGNQVTSLRRRWLFAAHAENKVRATYWGVGSAPERYDDKEPGGYRHTSGYPKGLASDVIAEIRTDMDAFSESEICILENHGYLLAEAAIKRWLPDLPTVDSPLLVPHPAWMIEEDVRAALIGSHKRTFLGREARTEAT